MALHINIEDLLSASTVESDRIEFKKGWNPDSIYRSICAFANDFDNTGGGYILIGVEENPETKVSIRPVNGLTTNEIGDIQKEMIGFDRLIRPYYSPKLSIEEIDNKRIIIIWVVAGNERPYEAPEYITAKHKKIWKYYIRRYASSIEATGSDKEELIALSNNIPFDDRANTQATIKDISMVLVQNHLRKIESKLVDEIDNLNTLEVLQQMALLSGSIEYIFPRNVSLMMFTEDPSKFFPYTQVDIVYFPNGEAEPFTEYAESTGTIPEQIKSTLEFLKMNFLKEIVIKPKDKAESIRVWNYPLQAIEEITVNCFYHRDYQAREPIEIRIYNNSIIFLNYGGPDRSIQIQSFQTGQVRPRRYRNRRLGDFLKELELTEGRATGIPTVFKALKNNGSPLPRFNTDKDHTFFEVELFVHPAFNKLSSDDVEVLKSERTKIALDKFLDRVIEQSFALTKGKDSNVASNVAVGIQNVDNVTFEALNGAFSTLFDAIASNIADEIQNTDNEVVGVFDSVDDTLVSNIADAIADIITGKDLILLKTAKQPINREMLFSSLSLKNQRKSYNEYVKPLVEFNWLSMTLPNKPTSPRQQYNTTLKGRLILKFLHVVYNKSKK